MLSHIVPSVVCTVYQLLLWCSAFVDNTDCRSLYCEVFMDSTECTECFAPNNNNKKEKQKQIKVWTQLWILRIVTPLC